MFLYPTLNYAVMYNFLGSINHCILIHHNLNNSIITKKTNFGLTSKFCEPYRSFEFFPHLSSSFRHTLFMLFVATGARPWPPVALFVAGPPASLLLVANRRRLLHGHPCPYPSKHSPTQDGSMLCWSPVGGPH